MMRQLTCGVLIDRAGVRPQQLLAYEGKKDEVEVMEERLMATEAGMRDSRSTVGADCFGGVVSLLR